MWDVILVEKVPYREVIYPTWGSLENHRLKSAFSQGNGMYPDPNVPPIGKSLQKNAQKKRFEMGC